MISKSSFIRGKLCLKSLYLHLNAPSLKDEVNDNQEHIFNIGHDTGRKAQDLFPGGIDASRGQPRQVKEALNYTQQLIEAGQSVIYEAAFSNGATLCYMDLLVKEDGQWQAFEVKASTGIKDYHLLDVAFQYYVICQSGLPLKEISLVHLNNQYVRRGQLDIGQLFTIANLTDHAKGMQAFVEENLAEMQHMLAQGQQPDIAPGNQCEKPFVCDFHGHCHPNKQQDLFTGVKGIRAAKIEKFRSLNVQSIEEVPPGMAISSKEWTVLKGLFRNENHQDADRINGFIQKLKYPLHFLDFETFMLAVPLYDESRPYQQLPFQYSLHKQLGPHSEPLHHEFLGTPPEDPRPEFIQRLLNEVEPTGSIIVYNKAFEQTRIRELARDFPAYAARLMDLNKRMIDLMQPFKSQWLYMPEMKGSYSVKKVLPALVPELSYNNLEIQEGNAASLIYLGLYAATDQAATAKHRQALLKYCEMDTLGLVEILKVLAREPLG